MYARCLAGTELSGRAVGTLAQDVRERLDEASTFEAMGRALVGLGRRKIGITGFSLFPLGTSSVEDSPPVSFSEQWSSAETLRRQQEILPQTLTELDALEAALKHRKMFRLAAHYGSQALARTVTYNEFWHPGRVEEQLLGVVPGTGGPAAFLCLARSGKDRGFNGKEHAAAEMLRREASRTIVRLQGEGAMPTAPNPRSLLALLQAAIPAACGLFEETGRPLWISDLMLKMGGVDAVWFWTSRLLRPSRRLSAWREIARVCCRGGAPGRELLQQGGITSCHRLRLSGRVVAVLVSRPERTDWKPTLMRAGLSAREAQVAWLLARGYSGLNVATVLALSEQTIRTYEKQIHRKLRVATRAELLLAVQGLLSRP